MHRDEATPAGDRIAVLISGGLDSAVLLRHALASRVRRPIDGAGVFPLYVRCGLSWEAVELGQLRRFLAALARPELKPLQVLDVPVLDLYDSAHWSVSGKDVPDAATADEAVFLPGRNVLLLGKAMLWCHLRGVAVLGLAPLGSNPFPDATPEFFHNFEKVVNQAVGGSVCLWLPFANRHKNDVMALGNALEMPWHLTFSCIRPRGEVHCGACNKCAERQKAFRDAGLADPTIYAPVS